MVILVLAAILRVVRLGADSLWVDEGYSVQVARLQVSDLVHESVKSDSNPPLYFLLLHLWMQAFGDSETAVRSLSVLFGIALVYVVYDVGRFLAGASVGLASALFAALSTFFIRYSQETRDYALVAFLAVLSWAVLLRLVERRTVPLALAYLGATTALLYAHVYALFVLLAQAVFLGVEAFRQNQEKRARWLDLARGAVLLSIPLAFYAPWASRVLVERTSQQFKGSQSSPLSWLQEPSWRAISRTFSGYSGSRPGFALVALLAVAAAVVAIRRQGGVGEPARRILSDRRVLVLLPWLLFPVVIPFLISKTIAPIFLFKYTIVAAPAFYLLLALGLLSSFPHGWALAGIGVVSAVFLAATVNFHRKHQGEEWRAATAFLAAEARPTDLVVVDSNYARTTSFAYYWRRRDVPELAGSRGNGVQRGDLGAVRYEAPRHQRVWLVVSHSVDKTGEILRAIEHSHRLRSERDFVGIQVLLFE